jgi:muramoyltetrapeptide carboxypeptidase
MTNNNLNIEVVAPSSGFVSTDVMARTKDILKQHNIAFHMRDDLLQEEDFFANSAEYQLNHLIEAISDDHTDIIWALKGGYGSSRLLPELQKIAKPVKQKIYIGYSDSSALLIFLNQQWGWQTIHGSGIASFAQENKDTKNITLLKEILFSEKNTLYYEDIQPINALAKNATHIEGMVTGGNLTLVENSIGTIWQLDAKNKIVILEEVNERGYRLDRMFNHLLQANLFSTANAIILGNFSPGDEPDAEKMQDIAIERFAENIAVPVFKTDIFGHGIKNYPFVLGAEGTLNKGNEGFEFSMMFEF